VTILWLVAIPLLAALLVFLLRELRLLSLLLAAGALVAMAVLLVARGDAEPVIVLGRAVSLSRAESLGLVFCCLILLVCMLYSQSLRRMELAQPIALASFGLLVGAIMVRNVIIAVLLLQIALVMATMLIPSSRPGSAMAGMRVVVLAVAASSALLIAAWALDSHAIDPQGGPLAGAVTVALIAGFGLGLGLVPFHVWRPAAFAYGNLCAIVLLDVVLGLVLLLQLDVMLGMASWSGMRDLVGMMLIGGGVLTSVAGGIMTMPQRSIGRALAYAALADLGVVALGLGIGTSESLQVATLHLAHRGLAVSVAAMGFCTLREQMGTDELDGLWGAWRRAPWAVVGVALGLLSMAGWPLTAGFATRYVLYRQVSAHGAGWMLPLVGSTLGPIWFVVRFITSALASAPSGIARRGAAGTRALIAILGFCLILLGVFPGLWSRVLGTVPPSFFGNLARLP